MKELEKFEKLSNIKKVDVLFSALEYMQQYNGRTINECIKLAMEELWTI